MYTSLLLSCSKLHKCDGLEQALMKNDCEFQIFEGFILTKVSTRYSYLINANGPAASTGHVLQI